MKKKITIVTVIVMSMMLMSSTFCFAGSIVENEEKNALLNQVEGASIDSDRNVTFSLEQGKPVTIELDNGEHIEYTMESSNLRASNKAFRVKKTISNPLTVSTLTLFYDVDCTWGTPNRCVTMNSFIATYSGVRAEVDNFSYKIIERVSQPSGFARAKCSGKITFAGNNQILTSTKTFEHEIYADSADSSNVYIKVIA